MARKRIIIVKRSIQDLTKVLVRNYQFTLAFYIHHKMGLGIAEIHRLCLHYINTTLQRHMKHDVEVDVDDRRRKNLGRAIKTTVRDFWQIIPTLQTLRRSVGMFSSTDIFRRLSTWMQQYQIERQTCPAWAWLWVPPVQEKGCPTAQDLPKGIEICLKMQGIITKLLDRSDIFLSWWGCWVHKTYPCQQTRTPRTRMWRKKGKELHKKCSVKCKKEGTEGRMYGQDYGFHFPWHRCTECFLY